MKHILKPLLSITFGGLILAACLGSDTENPGVYVGNPKISNMTLLAVGPETNDCKITDVSADGFSTTLDSNSFGFNLTFSQAVETEFNGDNIIRTTVETEDFSIRVDDTTLDDISTTAFANLLSISDSSDTLNVIVAKDDTFIASQDYSVTIPRNSITCADSTQNTAAYVVGFNLEENEDLTNTSCTDSECPILIEINTPIEAEGTENTNCKLASIDLISLYATAENAENSFQSHTHLTDEVRALSSGGTSTGASVSLNFANLLFSMDWRNVTENEQQIVGFESSWFEITDANNVPQDVQLYLMSIETPELGFIVQGLPYENAEYNLAIQPGAVSCAAGDTTATYTTSFTITVANPD